VARSRAEPRALDRRGCCLAGDLVDHTNVRPSPQAATGLLGGPSTGRALLARKSFCPQPEDSTT